MSGFFYLIRIAELLEFVAEDLTGRSLYTLCHVEDVRLLRKAHTDCKTLFLSKLN